MEIFYKEEKEKKLELQTFKRLIETPLEQRIKENILKIFSNISKEQQNQLNDLLKINDLLKKCYKEPGKYTNIIEEYVNNLPDNIDKTDIKSKLKETLNPPIIEIKEENVYNTIKALFFTRLGKESLDKQFNSIKNNPEDLRIFHDTLCNIFRNFYNGKIIIKIKYTLETGSSGEELFITFQDFKDSAFNFLYSMHKFETEFIGGEKENLLNQFENEFPQAKEVDKKIEQLDTKIFYITIRESRMSTILPNFKILLARAYKIEEKAEEGKNISREEIEEILNKWDEALDEIIKAKPKERKEKISKFGKVLKETASLIGIFLGTGFLAWSALFAFYLPLYLIEKMEKQISHGVGK